MMMLFTTLPVTALAKVPETEAPGVENVQSHETKETEPLEMSEAGTPSAVRAPQQGTTKDLTVEVTLDTTMEMIMDQTQSYTFRVNGKEYKIPVTSPTGSGPITFTATFRDVPFPDGQTEADVQLERLPEDIEDYHTVVQQEYNSNTKKLHVTLGRDFYIKVSNIKDGTTFDDLGIMNVPEFELTLYDNNEKEVRKSIVEQPPGWDFAACKFTGVQPGKYHIKITKVPNGFEDYDISRAYELEVKTDGNLRLEIYQKDGYALANFLGMPDSSVDKPLLHGMKNPLVMLVARKSETKKSIVKDGDLKQQLEVEKDDIVEYKITKTIYPDHNTVIYFQGYINIGTYVNQGFEDVLDANLEYQQDSLQVKLNGNETGEYKASYNAGSHKITLTDDSKVDLQEILNGVKLGEPQTLEVTFKVKVLKAEDTIINKVDDSTTELIPFTVKVEKHWDDQENQAGKRPASVGIQLKADGKVIKTVEVTARSDWKYTFTDLPKKNSDGTEIKYTVEEVPVEGYKTSIAGDVQNGFTVTNKFLPPPPTPRIEDVSIPVEKVWEDDGNRENLRPTSVTVRLYADGKDTGKSVVLTEANGWKGRFDALPKYDAGKRITYTVKEEHVAHYDSSVSGNQTDGFTVTNRVEEPPKPPIPPTPPTPPTPLIPRTIFVPTIPRAGVGA